MSEYVAAFALDDLPKITYARVNATQADFIARAMELPDNQARFTVEMLPVETPEQRQYAAEEWAGYKQASGNATARKRGAVFISSSRDESPEALRKLIEQDDAEFPYAPFVTHALLKVIYHDPEASLYTLMYDYYNQSKTSAES